MNPKLIHSAENKKIVVTDDYTTFGKNNELEQIWMQSNSHYDEICLYKPLAK